MSASLSGNINTTKKLRSTTKLCSRLVKLCPSSGCLTAKEAAFCNIFHSGEWNTLQKKHIFSKMQKEDYDEFLELKKTVAKLIKKENEENEVNEENLINKNPNKFNIIWINNLKETLAELAPNSGCLSKNEAKFCDMAHYGKWNHLVYNKYINKMNKLKKKKFLEAKTQYAEYSNYNELCY